MKTKALAFFTLAVLILNLSGLALADTRRSKSKKRQSNALVGMLPASDGVVTFDVKRFFNDAMPQILSANQPMLAKIMDHLKLIESKGGIETKSGVRPNRMVAPSLTNRISPKVASTCCR